MAETLRDCHVAYAPRNDKGADCHGVCVSSFKGTPYPYPSQMGIRTSCYFSQGQVGTGVDAHLSSSFPLSVRFTGKQNPCGCKSPVIAMSLARPAMTNLLSTLLPFLSAPNFRLPFPRSGGATGFSPALQIVRNDRIHHTASLVKNLTSQIL